jgi:hypothetical protein
MTGGAEQKKAVETITGISLECKGNMIRVPFFILPVLPFLPARIQFFCLSVRALCCWIRRMTGWGRRKGSRCQNPAGTGQDLGVDLFEGIKNFYAKSGVVGSLLIFRLFIPV